MTVSNNRDLPGNQKRRYHAVLSSTSQQIRSNYCRKAAVVVPLKMPGSEITERTVKTRSSPVKVSTTGDEKQSTSTEKVSHDAAPAQPRTIKKEYTVRNGANKNECPDAAPGQLVNDRTEPAVENRDTKNEATQQNRGAPNDLTAPYSPPTSEAMSDLPTSLHSSQTDECRENPQAQNGTNQHDFPHFPVEVHKSANNTGKIIYLSHRIEGWTDQPTLKYHNNVPSGISNVLRTVMPQSKYYNSVPYEINGTGPATGVTWGPVLKLHDANNRPMIRRVTLTPLLCSVFTHYKIEPSEISN